MASGLSTPLIPCCVAISAWREGNRIYLFAGKYIHEVALPAAQ